MADDGNWNCRRTGKGESRGKADRTVDRTVDQTVAAKGDQMKTNRYRREVDKTNEGRPLLPTRGK